MRHRFPCVTLCLHTHTRTRTPKRVSTHRSQSLAAYFGTCERHRPTRRRRRADADDVDDNDDDDDHEDDDDDVDVDVVDGVGRPRWDSGIPLFSLLLFAFDRTPNSLADTRLNNYLNFAGIMYVKDERKFEHFIVTSLSLCRWLAGDAMRCSFPFPSSLGLRECSCFFFSSVFVVAFVLLLHTTSPALQQLAPSLSEQTR